MLPRPKQAQLRYGFWICHNVKWQACSARILFLVVERVKTLICSRADWKRCSKPQSCQAGGDEVDLAGAVGILLLGWAASSQTRVACASAGAGNGRIQSGKLRLLMDNVPSDYQKPATSPTCPPLQDPFCRRSLNACHAAACKLTRDGRAESHVIALSICSLSQRGDHSKSGGRQGDDAC